MFFWIVSAKIPVAKVGTKKRCMKLRHTPLREFLILTVFLTVLFVYAVFLAFISSVSTCSLNASRSFSALSLY